MFYVFHVDTGTMVTFDTRLAVESVSVLQKHIEQQCKIPVDQQVLLASGGECLDPNVRVCTYSAGTDTNPVFLFTKSLTESPNPSTASINTSSDIEMKEKVAETHDLPATYQTVVTRSQIAVQFHELSVEQTKLCEELVHDQHLQKQGWSAVIANLDDITLDISKRAEKFEKHYLEYMAEHDLYQALVENFKEDLDSLEQIPLLPALLSSEDTLEEVVENKTDDTSASSDLVIKKKIPSTLLEWISATDDKSSLEQLYKNCEKGLVEYDGRLLEEIQAEVSKLLQFIDNPDMKEVKGIGERLFGLDQLLANARKIVQEQGDLAQSFQQNQLRAGNIGDTSILPDLCASHRRQLIGMLQNHQSICDIRRRCAKAKDELSNNILYRLKWIVAVESNIMELNQKLIIHNESLRRLRRQFDILRQIHQAPPIYVASISEVVRRRAFSQAFLMWASDMACHLLTVYNDEVARRKEFQSQFEGHFLNTLFPGMEDMPPSYATQAPSVFDSGLPKITMDDLRQLKEQLPKLMENLSIPDVSAVTSFFMLKSITRNETDRVDEPVAVEDKLVQVVNEVGLASNMDLNLLKPVESEAASTTTAHGLPHLKDIDKGCESETDTEEFEKVGQSPLDLHFHQEIPSPRPSKQDAATSTEENLETSRTEKDKLKTLLSKLADMSRQELQLLRNELLELKNQVTVEKSEIVPNYEALSSSLQTLTYERNNHEQEIIQRLTTEHETEISYYKLSQEKKDEELKSLRTELSYLETAINHSDEETRALKEELVQVSQKYKEQIADLECRIEAAVVERDKIGKEVTERLTREHRTEIDNIRSRFRLMTMERSPSDTSLERIERLDPKDESTLRQMKEQLEKQSKLEVEEAVTQEAQKWQKKLEEMQNKYEMMIQDVARRISEEKDKQIDVLREREANLNLECIKYKSTIQQLAECDTQSEINELLQKVELLEKENTLLQSELEKSKLFSTSPDLAASVAVLEGKADAATSPIKHKDKLSKSQCSLVKSGCITIDSCKVGDLVMIVWDQQHENYTIVQHSNYLYFLHMDCIESLGLKLPGGESRKMYCIAEVTEKEYCHARKAENRFKVPQGTRFYRIKARKLPNPKDVIHMSCQTPHQQPLQMSQSQQVESTPTPAQSSSSSRSVPTTPTKTHQMSESTMTVQSPQTTQCVSETCQMEESTVASVVYESSLESLTVCGDDTNKTVGEENRMKKSWWLPLFYISESLYSNVE